VQASKAREIIIRPYLRSSALPKGNTCPNCRGDDAQYYQERVDLHQNQWDGDWLALMFEVYIESG
jgi:hypothetical protein